MSIHVHFYREQSAVTLIQHVQHSKNRLGAETIAALLQPHRSWNALPDRNRVQCERFNPLTWVRKKIRTANGVCVKQALQFSYLPVTSSHGQRVPPPGQTFLKTSRALFPHGLTWTSPCRYQ